MPFCKGDFTGDLRGAGASTGSSFIPLFFGFAGGLRRFWDPLWEPGNPLVWNMINKNDPLVAFLFDVTGMMMLSGIVLAWVRGFSARKVPPAHRLRTVSRLL
jgi:hypothetical protein